MKNRMAIKALICCTHFLARRHIPHMTNFDQLVDLIVSCGAEDLRKFLERTGKNASYTSKIAVVEFIEAVGLWAEENLLKRLHQASCFSLMADECTVEELSISCRWGEGGVPVEHFLEIVPLKSADAKTIYSTLVEFLKEKNAKRQCSSSTVHEKHRSKYRLPTSNRKYNKKWEESFTWLTYDDNFQGAFCKVCRKRGISLQRTGGT